jgi:hypothetical protein
LQAAARPAIPWTDRIREERTMRAETEAKAQEIKQSLALLRRSL